MPERSSLRWRARTAKNGERSYDGLDEHDNDSRSETKRRVPFCMDVVAALAVGASLLTWQLTHTALVGLACFFTLVLAPYTAYQHRKASKLKALRAIHNVMRQHHNSLQVENAKLHSQATRLHYSVENVRHVEDELMEISGNQRHEVHRLCRVVAQHEAIQKQIKQKLRAATLQQLLRVVVQSDKNADFSLSPTEVEILIVRLGMMDGVKLNETQFRKQIRENSINGTASLPTIMSFVRSLMNEHERNPMFVMQPQDLRQNMISADR